jgi:acetyltransferase-like isoleucine patch superfamily enzyme
MNPRRFLRLVTAVPRWVLAGLSPESYARIIGVNCGEGVRIYGSSLHMFGTEPWLVSLGSNVHISQEVLFVTHDGGTLAIRHLVPSVELTAPISVGSNVYIGARAIILPGVTIGSDCIVGAGTVVTRDIPNGTVVAGVPARSIRSISEYRESAERRSIGIGHLSGQAKAQALRKHFGLKRD